MNPVRSLTMQQRAFIMDNVRIILCYNEIRISIVTERDNA